MASTPSDLSIRRIAAKDARGSAGEIIVIEFLDRRLIDAAHIEQLGGQIMELASASVTPPRIVISFAKVDYLSSTTLNVLIELENVIRRKGGKLRLAGLAPDLQKVFTIMKLHKVMTICDTVDDAVASLVA
jgi:anti-anti-sigma factor